MATSSSTPSLESSPSSTNDHSSANTNGHSNGHDAGTVTLYKPPTFVGIVRSAAINLVLPFINGLMLGFGELFAHELAFRLGWSGTRIFPSHRANPASRTAPPGVEIRKDTSTRDGQILDKMTSLE